MEINPVISAVCTLDWLRAITPTKEASHQHPPPPPIPLFLPPSLSCLCQINPLNFLKDLPPLCFSSPLLLVVSASRSLSVFFVPFVFYFRRGTWKGRLPPCGNSCRVLPDYPPAPSHSTLKASSPPSGNLTGAFILKVLSEKTRA